MQCENAYLEEGRKHILCRKAPKPTGNGLKGEAHSLCGFQRFCPNVRACVMLPGWEKCRMREQKDKPEKKDTGKPTRRKRGKTGE